MHKIAVILAGGEGRRAGGDVPKQFRDLCGRPVVWWSMKAFHDEAQSADIVLVLHPGFFDDWDIMVSALAEEDRIPHILCCGGKDRTTSVANGLMTVADILKEKGLAPEEVLVAIHDGARPLLRRDMISRGWSACTEGVCGVPAVRAVSSLRSLDSATEPLDRCGSIAVDRAIYAEVQTPQTFVAADALRCYENRGEGPFTDDASLAEADGMSVRLYEGSPDNLKITNPSDHLIAETLLRDRTGIEGLTHK